MTRVSLARTLLLVVAAGFFANAEAEPTGYARCIELDQGSNSLTDFILNRCNVKLAVKWFDDGECRTGCRLDVGPGGRQSAGKIGANSHFGACEWPTNPVTNNRMLKFSCGGAETTGSGARQQDSSAATSQRAPANASRAVDNSGGNHPSTTGMPFGSGSIRLCPALDDYYPMAARRQGITGRVTVYVHANEAGNPITVSVLRSSGDAKLDEGALKYARVCRYKPEPGYAVSEVMFVVRFELQQ